MGKIIFRGFEGASTGRPGKNPKIGNTVFTPRFPDFPEFGEIRDFRKFRISVFGTGKNPIFGPFRTENRTIFGFRDENPGPQDPDLLPGKICTCAPSGGARFFRFYMCLVTVTFFYYARPLFLA